MTESASILVAVVAYVVVAFGWPTVRFWQRHRVWPIVFSREAAPAQRLLGALTAGLLLAVAGAAALRLVLGAEGAGIWRVPVAVRALGWVLFCGGAVLTLIAQRQMGASWRVGIDERPTALVTSGTFRVVRNPIFSGLLLSLAGFVCLSPAPWSVGLWAVAAAGIRLQVSWEERHLVALHGAAYLDWAARVGRLVPLVGRLRS